jgi:iron complex outermembrane receptor protein
VQKANVFPAALLASTMLQAAPCAAQSAGAAQEASSIDEIIVTANRRSEDVQKVPISVAVVNNEQLTALGVTNVDSLQNITTDLRISNLNDIPGIYIRGMGSAQLLPGAESPVGLYMDGVYIPFASSADQSLLDIDRVEVLKGPQGTLYGRNTTGGAINFITRDPSMSRAVEMLETVGNFGTEQFQAYVSSGPGRVSASLAGDITEHGPYLRNLGTGRDLNNRQEQSIRGKVKFQIADTWTAVLSGDYSHRNDYSVEGFIQVAARPTAAALGGNYTTLANPNYTYSDFPSTGAQYEGYGASLTVRGDLSFADFVSISGYRNINLAVNPDPSASNLQLTAFRALSKLENESQEFQLISKDASKLQWIVGVYAFYDNGGLGPVGVFNQGNTTGSSYADANIIVSGFGTTKAYAGYGQATYEIVEGLKATAGLRYSWEKRTLTDQTVSIPGLGTIVDSPRQSSSADATDPKYGIEYSWGTNLLYGTFTKGFRSGSYNLTTPGEAGPTKPETVKAFEIGGKHTLIPHVRFNWALFHYDYSDLQVSISANNGQGGLFLVDNAASATIKGAEAELDVSALHNLSLSAGLAYLDAKFSSYQNAEAFLPIPNGYGLNQTTVDATGRPLPLAPKWSANATATYTVPIKDGSLDLTGSAIYSASSYLDSPSGFLQSSFTIANARLTYNLPGNHVAVSLFANNIFDKRYVAAITTNAFGVSAEPNDPRIFGASVSLKY